MAASGEGEWQEVDAPDGAFRIDLPAGELQSDGEKEDDGTVRTRIWTSSGSSHFGVTTWNYATGNLMGTAAEELVRDIPATSADGATVTWSRRTEVADHGAVEFGVERPDGRIDTATGFLVGRRLYYLWVQANEAAVPALDRMTAGLELLPAPTQK
jgi:hypothetical protein